MADPLKHMVMVSIISVLVANAAHSITTAATRHDWASIAGLVAEQTIVLGLYFVWRKLRRL